MKALNHTPIIKNLFMPGYVLDEDILTRIDKVFTTLLQDNENSKYFFIITDINQNTLNLSTLEEVVEYFNNEDSSTRLLALEYRIPDEVYINITFNNDGNINITSLDRAGKFQLSLEELLREIKRCEQDYNWLIKYTLFKSQVKKYLSLLILPLSILLLFNIAVYFYATYFGVNVNSEHLVKGTDYYKAVSDAINSDSLSEKLDVLLKGEFKEFNNATNVIYRTQHNMIIWLIVLALDRIFYFILNKLSKLYPLSYYCIGFKKKKYESMKEKRTIWITGIFITFIINIVTGIILAFFKIS